MAWRFFSKSKRSLEERMQSRYGGLPFFLSLAGLLVLGLLQLRLLPSLFFRQEDALFRLFAFGLGGVFGFWMSLNFLKGRISVFLHESKHAIVSGLVGNRWKGMKIDRNSGHFEYSYTKDTAEYNAMIALAPYWLPLFSFFGFLLALALWRESLGAALFLFGLSYGGDLTCNFRDISPQQSDFSRLRGGYLVGILYVVAMNLTLGTLILAGVFRDWLGLFELYGELYVSLLSWIKSASFPSSS